MSVERIDALWPCADGLQPDRDTVIGEGEAGIRQIRFARKISLPLPHAVQHQKRARLVQRRPILVGEKWVNHSIMPRPRSWVMTRSLAVRSMSECISAISRANARPDAIRHVAVESVERAEAVARIRPAQILLHLPGDARSRHDESVMDLPHERDALFAMRAVAPEHGNPIEPRG